MKMHTAEFVKSAMRLDQCPADGRPEIAFVGRSNVGKSSLLNRIMKRKRLAQTSKTPGKTRSLNYYSIDGRIYFVDLPGYGFAQVSKTLKQEWGRVMGDYLGQRGELRLCVQLVDARHKPTALDQDMMDFLEDHERPTIVVATKIDKLKRGQRAAAIKTIRQELDLVPDALVLPFSAETGEGAGELAAVIAEYAG